ncbi:universal stress protein A-like protein isoform X2 [Castanea sativa]|uniref:universal stress protein A-like protein isoform X2 n=1 Tax=Castanea sativa TaxID=21020 RepID=UPI003F6526F5
MEIEDGSVTRILMGVSESTIKGYPHASISSRGAFDWTIQKIVRYNTSAFKLLFLHVQVPDEDGFDDMDSIYASPEDFKSLTDRDRAKGLHLLAYFVTRCHEIGVQMYICFEFLSLTEGNLEVSCEAWIKRGDPKEVICHEVKRVQPDLLVVGSRGLGPFQRVFVGTVSEFCVKHAECPVITIKRSADEAPQDPVDD